MRQIAFFVLLPTAVVAVYLFAFAANEYTASAQFAVRGDVEPMESVGLGQFTGLIRKHNSQDSYIVRDYIQSQTLVQTSSRACTSRRCSPQGGGFLEPVQPERPDRGTDPLLEQARLRRHRRDLGRDPPLGARLYPEDALAIAREVWRGRRC